MMYSIYPYIRGGGTYRTSTNISHLPAFNNIIESLHNFLPRRLPIQPVDLQYINVRAQSGNAGVHSVEDMLARQADSVDEVVVVASACGDRWVFAFIVDAEETLCHDYHAVAGDVVFL